MSDVQILTLKGAVYELPPFNYGQMRRRVDPLLERTQAILARIRELQERGPVDDAEYLELALEQRKIAAEQAALVLAALQNRYPHLTIEDLDELTPARLTTLYNQIIEVTASGANEPGEPAPPRTQGR